MSGLNRIVSKTDWAKIIILVIISTIFWTWVYIEYQKPIIPDEWVEVIEN